MHSNVILNSVDLTQLDGVVINSVHFSTRANRNMSRKQIARDDRQKLVNANWSGKTITIKGVISATTRVLWEQYRDNFMKHLTALETTLSVQQAGATSLYTGSVDDFEWDETPAGGFGAFVIVFVSSVPYRQASAFTTAREITGITVADTTNGFGVIAGSYKAAPKITITITSVTGATNKHIKITDQATSKYIQISGTFANSDVIIIDSDTKTITQNGTEVDFAGVMPEFDPGAISLRYQDTFTTRNVAVKVEYKQRDL